MAGQARYSLIPDRKGVIWDLLLYVPTVVILAMIGIKLWYGANQELAYVLFFLASFFFIAGANRILKTRLMLVSTAPIVLDIGKDRARLELRGGGHIDLIKDLRYYADTQGKSFALTGTDVLGRRQQYIFHRGQFAEEASFREINTLLKVYQ
ncbi:MAG: hypothetical protein ABIQ54_01015 [Gammaproteobacteria bacterium]